MEATIQTSLYEIERGKPMPSKNHAFIQSKLIKMIFVQYQSKFEVLSELTLDLNGKERVPDLCIYKEIHFTPGADEVRVSQMPLGVIEILSPSQHITELIMKSNQYFEAGILSYWLVIPDLKTIYTFSASNDYEVHAIKDLLIDARLGIELDLGELFKEN